MAETRDNETGSYIPRTQGYVEILCRELLHNGHPELIVKAAPLRDIGKVGIPDDILLKPGELNEAEWVIMCTHASLGSAAIQRAIEDEADQSAFDFFHVAMKIARHHHER